MPIYQLVSDELGCVQTAVRREYLLMARYVSHDQPLLDLRQHRSRRVTLR
jgi:hypothetical protein